MNATTDLLRGELERLFELDDMLALSTELLGLSPDELGGATGKGAFARALVERCAADDALPALADAIVFSNKGTAPKASPSKAPPPSDAPTDDLAAGTMVGPFKIQKKLGEGGTGVTYLAERSGDGAVKVALKVLRHTHARDRAAARRWQTLMRALAKLAADPKLEDRSLGRVLDVGSLPDGRPWAATEHVEGQSLAQRIARTGPMHFNEARPIVRGVLAALETLHKRGIAHGNVKTENVFLVRPSASDRMRNEPTGVLVDAGADRLVVARIAGPGTSGVIAIAGTPKAIAPEQARSGQATASSDLYAVGCLLYELLTGSAPHEGASAIDVIASHLSREPDAPSAAAPRGWVARELDSIVLRALAKEPAQRYASASELREALESIGRASIPPEARKKEDLDAAALESAKKALLEKPADEELAVALERVCEPAEAWDKAIAIFHEAVEKAGDLDAKKALLFRVARLADTELRDHSQGEAAYRKILELDGEDEIARVALEELKRQSGDGEGLVELLLEKVEKEEVASERAAILREIAETYERSLSDGANAFVAWVQALSEDPRDERTAKEIERLAGSDNERWNEALASLNEAVQAASDDADKVHLYVLMGRWYAERLSRPDFALPCFGQALTVDPSSDAALEGTIELYRKAQSWQELAQLLLRRADVAASPTRARDYRAEAAEVTHRRLSDPDRAAEIFEQVLADDPAHPKATEALEMIYSERKQWPSLVRLLEKKAHNQRGAERIETLCAIAEVYEDRVNDRDKALSHYQSVLEIDAHHLPTLKGLERIYSQQGKFAELLTNLRAQLEQVPTPRQKISLLERIGGIHEEEFVEHAKAAEAFEQIVAIEPGHDAANSALGRLYRQLHRFDDLAATLQRHALSSHDEKRKISLLLQATKVLMVDVGAPDRALHMAERVLGADAHNAEALELVARLKAQSGDVQSAVDAVRRMADAEKEPAKKAELYVRAGRIRQDAGDRDGAIEQYKAALDADKDNPIAAQALRAIYEQRGDAHGAADLLAREIELTDGPIRKAKLLSELAVLQRDRLRELGAARDAFKKALELDSTCTPAARGLGDLAFDAGNMQEAAKLYEPLLARTSEMTTEEARDVSVRCGDAFRKLGSWDKAQRAYLNAKAFAPTDRDVLERVAEVTFESGAPDEAAELYRGLFEQFDKELAGKDRERVLWHLGEALRKSEQLDEAQKILEQATQAMPESAARSLDSLKKVFESKGEWEKVVSTLRRAADLGEDEARFAALVEAGDVLASRIGDKARASKSYVAALEVKADDRNLLTKLMAVYSETKDWSKLVEIILRIAELVTEPMQLAKYFNTAAAISHHELGRLDEAADYYEQALEHAPGLAKAFEGLVSALSQKSDWTRLEAAYRARIKRVESLPADKGGLSGADLAHLWDSLGELLKHRLNNTADAVEAFEKALKLDADNRRRIELLAEMYAAEPKRYFGKAVVIHQALLARSPYRIESYQALRKLFTEAKKPDESWCVCQALASLKNAEPDEEAFYKKHRRRQPAAAKENLSDEMWARFVMHADLDPLLTDIFTAVLPAVIAVRSQPLSMMKLDASQKKDPAKDPADMARTLHYASGVTRIALPDVYYRNDDQGGLSFVLASPPGIGLGKGAQGGGPAQALAFLAGRHLTYFRGGLYLRHLVPTGSGLRGWLLAAIKIAVPQFPVPNELSGAVSEAQIAIKQHLSGPAIETLRSLVNKLLSAAPELDLKRWTAAVDLTADRVGFVLANDLELALAVIRASPEDAAAVPSKDRLRELHMYSVSDQYLSLRHKLGIAIGD